MNNLFLDFLKPISPMAEICSRVSICASVLMVVALSYERQFAICWPHTYRINLKIVPRWRHLMKFIGPVILCSLVFNLPIFLNTQVNSLGPKITFLKYFAKIDCFGEKCGYVTYFVANVPCGFTSFISTFFFRPFCGPTQPS